MAANTATDPTVRQVEGASLPMLENSHAHNDTCRRRLVGGGDRIGRRAGVGGGFDGGGAPFGSFHGGMPAFHGGAALHDNFVRRSQFAEFGFGHRRGFDFDRDRDFDFRHHRHRRFFFFAGAPFFGFDYGGYPYDCSPYWNGYRWVYPYGYACGYGASYWAY